MVHGLDADERANYLKRAILLPPTPSIQARIPKAKLKYVSRRQDRRVVERSRKSSGR